MPQTTTPDLVTMLTTGMSLTILTRLSHRTMNPH
jgi:hypothetical protein